MDDDVFSLVRENINPLFETDMEVFVAYLNSKRNLYSGTEQQKLIQGVSYYLYNFDSTYKEAFTWSKENISGLPSDLSLSTMREWMDHHDKYGECPFETARRLGGRQWKSILEREEKKNVIIKFIMICSLL